MRPQDLELFRGVSDPQLQPDGDLVAHVVAVDSVREDRTRSSIHVFDLADDSVRAFTTGLKDRSPRWSPDGTRLAFLRAPRPGAESQVAVMDADGGEATVLTELPLGVEELTWTPDGTRIVITGTEWRPGWGELSADERADQPRRITGLGFRHDDEGWLHDRVTRAWVVDPTGEGDPRPLTPADHSVAHVAVTADGADVVFTSPRHAEHETEPGEPLCRVPLAGGPIEQLVPAGEWHQPAAAADGGMLLCGLPRAFDWPRPPGLHHVAMDGTVSAVAPQLDRDVDGGDAGPLELSDGSVLVLVEDRGAVQLARVGRDGACDVLVGGAQCVTGVTTDPDGRRIVYAATHPTDPGELWLLEDGEARVLTAHNEQLRERLLPVEHFTFERDGVEVDAWAVLPDAAAGDSVPLLLNIHGGPTAQYAHGYLDEFQVEAGAGYGVVACNPRGSSGRGAAWSTAVVGAWMDEGSVDVLDLEAAVDAALARFPRLDPDRLGIMGGSYGGYATARMLARTDRFRSAIVERGLLAWPSFAGTSDIGAYFDRMFLDRTMPQDLLDQWAASPVRTAARISTPTLVLHSLEDHRCPPEQAYQFFSMLRRHGVESELLLFPDEGHELSRSGSPKHRVQRFEAVLDWHERYLRG